jgi:amino acid transporter
MAYAAGASGLAFGLAGIVYIMIGLAYTELAATYPVAGGGQYFTLRGLGDFWGFVAGSALLLDYTIDIALFSVACAGYINYFLPSVLGVRSSEIILSIGPFHNVQYLWLAETLALIAFLVWLNIRGIRESSLLNEVIGIVVIATEVGLIVFGFVAAWHPEIFTLQWTRHFPSTRHFMYGTSLAIISFVGLESISQVAQETRRPATIVPRTSIALIFSVFLFATAFSVLGLGMQLPAELGPDGHGGTRMYTQPWDVLGLHSDNPVAVMAKAVPYIGIIAGPFAAALGALILLVSANSGVMSASRLTFSMSRFGFIDQGRAPQVSDTGAHHRHLLADRRGTGDSGFPHRPQGARHLGQHVCLRGEHGVPAGVPGAHSAEVHRPLLAAALQGAAQHTAAAEGGDARVPGASHIRRAGGLCHSVHGGADARDRTDRRPGVDCGVLLLLRLVPPTTEDACVG